jgi:hypothetical protein
MLRFELVCEPYAKYAEIFHFQHIFTCTVVRDTTVLDAGIRNIKARYWRAIDFVRCQIYLILSCFFLICV